MQVHTPGRDPAYDVHAARPLATTPVACRRDESALLRQFGNQAIQRRAASRVSAQDDALERDADRAAERATAASLFAPTPHAVQSAPLSSTTAAGTSLDPCALTQFESHFGHDFSQVKIHTDEASAQQAVLLGALAFTVGSDIVFAPSRFRPADYDGRRLIAHELAHVVQQSAMGSPALQMQPNPAAPRVFTPAPAPGVSPPPPPVPGSPAAIRAEAIEIGQKWGELLADRENALDILQTKRGGVSAWDRMSPEQRREFTDKIQAQLAMLPVLPQYDRPELLAAQDDGFAAGVQSGYTVEKLANFLVNLGTELALLIFSGLAARGIRVPRLISQALRRLPPMLTPAATSEEVAGLVARVRAQYGRVVYNIGGRAASGEPVGAINVNPERLVGGIPNHVPVKGEVMDRVLPLASGDEVYSRNLVGDINWNQLARASKAVVKPGGTVTLSPWGGQLGELPEIEAAMKSAGFKNVRLEYNIVVKGER